MAPTLRPRLRTQAARGGTLGSVSSMLRLAARERQASATAPAWLKGLTRALRSAGPGQGPAPMHGMLAGMEFAPSEWLSGR